MFVTPETSSKLIFINNRKYKNTTFAKDLFLQREEAIEIVSRTAPKILKVFEQNLTSPTLKRDHTFFGVIGGSGAGKTRAATEVTRILSELQGFENVQEIYVDFSNGNQIYNFEAGDADSILGARIFAQVFRKGERISDFQESQKLYKYYFDQKVFTISKVLRLVSAKFREWLGLDKETPLPITLILDEFQEAISLTPDWKRIAHNIGNYNCFASEPNPLTIATKLVVVPIIAGTLHEEEVSLAPTYETVLLPLPAFNTESIGAILKNEKLDKRLIMGRELKRFWHHMGLVPRNLEDAVKTARDVLKEFDHVSDESEIDFKHMVSCLYHRTRVVILARYGFDVSPSYTSKDERLVFHAIAAKAPDQQDEANWLVSAIRRGQVFKTKTGLLYLPYFVFMALVERHYPTIYDFLPLDATTCQWSYLEELDLRTLAFRINQFIMLLNKSKIQMKELFPGAVGARANDVIDIQRVAYTESLEHFGHKDSRTHKYMYKSPQDTIVISGKKVMQPKDRVNYVMRCISNNKALDGIFFAKDGAKDVLILIKYKFENTQKTYGTDSAPMAKPKKWYNKAKEIESEYPNHVIYFVYITNAKFSSALTEKVKREYPNLLVVDGNVSDKYVSPNILPYYKEKTDFADLVL